MLHTIYRITNLLDGKIYVGKHSCRCNPCKYMGSGKRLRYAISKYGIENFKKEILFAFQTEVEMNAKEAELVTEEFVARSDTYNICFGGQGGFGYINTKIFPNTPKETITKWKVEGRIAANKALHKRFKEDVVFNTAWREKISEGIKTSEKCIARIGMPGIPHTEEWKQNHSIIMKEKQKGDKNSQFGTMWITNGTENRKIKKDLDSIPEGWYKGRR